MTLMKVMLMMMVSAMAENESVSGDGINHVEFFVGELILAQLTQTHIGLQHHLAGRWFQIPAENFHKGRLAAAIGSDQAVTVAVVEFDGNVLEQGLGPELHGDVGGGDQRTYLSIT